MPTSTMPLNITTAPQPYALSYFPSSFQRTWFRDNLSHQNGAALIPRPYFSNFLIPTLAPIRCRRYNEGKHRLEIGCGPPPENLLCASRTLLSCASGCPEVTELSKSSVEHKAQSPKLEEKLRVRGDEGSR